MTDVLFVVFSDDKNLPSVPPLQLSVPADYPDQSPYWADDGEQYGETIIYCCSQRRNTQCGSTLISDQRSHDL